MDSSKIKTILAAVIASFAALYLGITAATAQFETIAWVVGGITLTACLMLGRKIWLLIPFLGAVNLTLRLPGLPNSLLLAQALVLGFSILPLLMRKLPFRLRFSELEAWVILLTLFVLQVYARHPVSVSIFGGASVGGKPYIIFAISLVTAILLSGLIVPSSELKAALRLSIIGGLINFGTSLLGRLVPSIGFWTGASYLDTSVPDYTNAGVAVDSSRATRASYLSDLGQNLSLWISTFKSPLKACFQPLWAALIMISLAAAMLSGFRNAVIMVGFTYIVGLCYRGGFSAILMSAFGGVAALTLLAIVNLTNPLPPNVQRSLSFLPGTWDAAIKLDAAGSNEWRYEIWREVLLTDRWIQNKYVGDGLGFSAAELALQMSLRVGARQGISGFDAHRESILSSGDYHSGPVQTIRIIGYFGLVVLVLFQIRLGVHAHRQIVRCRNTEWFPVALFFGIPLVWSPVFFVFVFGTFTAATSSLFLGYAMVRLMENNLPLPIYVKRSRVPYILNSGDLAQV